MNLADPWIWSSKMFEDYNRFVIRGAIPFASCGFFVSKLSHWEWSRKRSDDLILVSSHVDWYLEINVESLVMMTMMMFHFDDLKMMMLTTMMVSLSLSASTES